MNPFEQLFCRAFQLVFRAALPLLPYREPVELTGLAAVPPLLREKGVTAELLVTDRGVRSLGLTGPLETALAAQDIACAVYDGALRMFVSAAFGLRTFAVGRRAASMYAVVRYAASM